MQRPSSISLLSKFRYLTASGRCCSLSGSTGIYADAPSAPSGAALPREQAPDFPERLEFSGSRRPDIPEHRAVPGEIAGRAHLDLASLGEGEHAIDRTVGAATD